LFLKGVIVDVRLKEIEQDKEIVAYTAQKEREFALKDLQFKQKAADKEKEVGRLRAAQERVPTKPKTSYMSR
jgi:hypothetical protein